MADKATRTTRRNRAQHPNRARTKGGTSKLSPEERGRRRALRSVSGRGR